MTTFLLVMIVLVAGIAWIWFLIHSRPAFDVDARGCAKARLDDIKPIIIGYGAKPRIRKIIDDLWVCSDSLAAGYGMTPQEAYKVYSGRLAKNPTGG